MALFDLPLSELQSYKPLREEPPDWSTFWQQTLEETRAYPLNAQVVPADFGLRTIDTFDLTFSGYGGQPVKGWFMRPHGAKDRLPCVVEFIGYGGGRGFPYDWLAWPSAGFAYVVMDTRGQGSVWLPGDTPDPEAAGPQVPGFMTRGVLDPQTYYYRRVFADGVRAVEAARGQAGVDPDRVAVTGGSQGGGIALAVAGLEPAVAVTMPDVPFLCHYRRAIELIDTHPYAEITMYLHVHRDQADQVFRTLSYFDGVNFGAHCRAQALFSVGLMDDICPPSTVFAAYNHYGGPKDIRVYPFNKHEGGESFHLREKVRFLQRLWGS